MKYTLTLAQRKVHLGICRIKFCHKRQFVSMIQTQMSYCREHFKIIHGAW